MRDAAEFGQAIAARSDDIETALAEYEQALFPRSAEHAAAAAYQRKPEDMINFFTRDE
jgi:hypothetical protein